MKMLPTLTGRAGSPPADANSFITGRAIRRQSHRASPPTHEGNKTRLRPSVAKLGQFTIAAWVAFLLVLAATPRAGAGEPVDLVLDVGSMERTAVLYPPSGPEPAEGFPLVLMFHGHGGVASRQARRHAIHEFWAESIVVYPQGLPGIRGRTDPRGIRSGWQMRPGQAEDRDLRFVDRLLEEIPRRFPVDANRVYAAGHSNGGRFAAVLWVARPDRFAAIASGCGQGGRLILDAPPKPVMMIMGEADRIVPIRGQLYSVNLARERLRVDPGSARKNGWLSVEKGIDGVELVTYIHPGGHEWPKQATPCMIEFFKRHTLAAPGAED